MAERDPFGRDTGEDPLAEMGWSASRAAPPPERVAAGAEIARPESGRRAERARPTAIAAPAGRNRRLGCLTAVILAAAGLAALATLGSISADRETVVTGSGGATDAEQPAPTT